jgi:hypothetical protein
MLGLPKFFLQLEELFQSIAVDGSTSTIPGQSNFDDAGDGANGGLEDEEAEDANTDKDYIQTPQRTTSSKKRSSSSTDTATSPSKGLHVPKKASVATVM